MKLPTILGIIVILLMSIMQVNVNATEIARVPAFTGEFSSLNHGLKKTKASKTTLVNINKAGVKELSGLPGLGVKKAEAIIKYRELNGSFASVDELVNVKGIGPKMFAKLKGLIAI